MNAIRQFLRRVRTVGKHRPTWVKTVAMGRERIFDAYDIGADTYIFERGVIRHLADRPSVLIVEKRALGTRAHGRVMTLSTGNHSVAAFPLLDGRFWKLSHLAPNERSAALLNSIVCANVAGGETIELSQREVATDLLVRTDAWLQLKAGFSMDGVVMGERNDATLEYFRCRGQEWRVKPLAWSEAEMRVALAAAKKRIATRLEYYHSAKGVHFLTYSEFCRFAALAHHDVQAFLDGLNELVGVYEGNDVSFLRMPKHRGHHEIELFGIQRGESLARLVPELERLLGDVNAGQIGKLGIIQRADELCALWHSLLARPEFADETAKEFIETLYINITGEVYAIVGAGTTPAFDDRRTALPGATFIDGRLQLHPGADSRTKVLLANLRDMLSKDEIIEYANIYELREDENSPVGHGLTREVVYKTNLRPVEASLIEKGLSSTRTGYTRYMLARVGALRSIGVGLSDYYRLLRRRARVGGRTTEFYVRTRCDGETIDSIPASYFHDANAPAGESVDVVEGLATLMGDAAAQNLMMKKFDPKTESPLFGVGKEIYGFSYDIARARMMPKMVYTCSIRGSFGWPNLEYTDANLAAIASFYLTHFAHALKAFQHQHSVPMRILAERFMSGFEFRTHAMHWHLSVMRDKFEAFAPDIPKTFQFNRRWRFLMWSLDRQNERLPRLRELFFQKVDLIEKENP